MITGGHIAASYLLTQTATYFGYPISPVEIMQVIVAGNIVDVDFLTGMVTGKTGEAHHQNITHTPFGTLIIWGVLLLILRPTIVVAVLLLLSLLLHLVLDDIGYWMYKLKLITLVTNPQINWLYPFRAYHKNKLIMGNVEVIRFYFLKAWPVALMETILIIAALFVFLKQ